MDNRETDGFDFESAAGDKAMLRKSFRVPLMPDDRIVCEIDGVALDLYDIGYDGVGIWTDSVERFRIGDRFEDIALLLGGRRQHFVGRVIHRTRVDENRWMCGIALEADDGAARAALVDWIDARRDALFGSGRSA